MQVNIQVEIDSIDNVHNLLQIVKSMNYVSQAEAFDGSGKMIQEPSKEVITIPASELDALGYNDNNFKPMTVTDFYKKVNAWNLDQREGNLIDHETLKTEITSW